MRKPSQPWKRESQQASAEQSERLDKDADAASASPDAISPSDQTAEQHVEKNVEYPAASQRDAEADKTPGGDSDSGHDRQSPGQSTVPAHTMTGKRGDEAPSEDGDQRPVSASAHPGAVAVGPISRGNESLHGTSGQTSFIGWLVRRVIHVALFLLAVVLALVAVGIAQRVGWIQSGSVAVTEGTESGATGTKRYVCPMMCVPPTTQPGRCPVCGMELVEASADASSDGRSVVIDPVARRLVGIRTAMAKKRKVERTIRAIGAIEYDQNRLATIGAHVDGRIERLYAHYVGVPVRKNYDLALVYSPDLYTAQVEYLTAIDRQQASRILDESRLVVLAEEKLRELGLTDDQIEQLRQSRQPQPRVRLRSPLTGTVIAKSVVEGDYVKTGQTIYRVADLSTVWLMLDLFPDDAAFLKFGQEVEAEIAAAPGIVFTGRIAFIDPTVNRETRTVQVRVEMLNLDGKLRPGDYATARVRVPPIPRDYVYDPALAGKYISPMHPQVIRDHPGKCPICGMDLVPTSELGFLDHPPEDETVLTVPRRAVLMAGGNSVVYVEKEPGKFEVRKVAVAALTDQWAVIAAGLKPGEIVATDGNFLIDSQSQLVGNPSLLDPRKAPEYPPGPLELPQVEPELVDGETGKLLDGILTAYLDIHAALAADTDPPIIAVNRLIDQLQQLMSFGAIHSYQTVLDLRTALDAAENLTVSLDTARMAYRRISHVLLRLFNRYRSPASAAGLYHFYCPMVPGGGGDWLQNTAELKNPYWGAQMLSCGELVRQLGAGSAAGLAEGLPEPGPIMESSSEDPFAGLQLQPLRPLPEAAPAPDGSPGETVNSDQAGRLPPPAEGPSAPSIEPEDATTGGAR